jgi:hypothetical protein
MKKKFFHLSLLLLFLDPGSGIRDPRSGMGKNQDPGSGINIPDPQHWYLLADSICCSLAPLMRKMVPVILERMWELMPRY